MNKSQRLQILLLMLIFLTAFFIRGYDFKINEAFISSDEVRLVLATTDFLQISNSNISEISLHVFRFFAYAWGPTIVFLSSINLIILTLLQLPLTEKTLIFYHIVIGAFSPIVLYFLTKEIYKKFKIAYLSAIILAILPIHVSYSRTSGDSMISTLLLMLVILFCIKYVKTQKRKFALFSSVFLGFYVGATSQFLGVIPLLLMILFIFQKKKGLSIFKPLFNIYFILPFLLMFFPIFASWIYYWVFRGDMTLGVIGHMFSREKSIGFHSEFLTNMHLNAGLALAILFIIVLIYTFIKIYHSWKINKSMNLELFLICWFLIYSLPWLFLVEPGNVSYLHYISALMPLLILSSKSFYSFRTFVTKKKQLFCDFALAIVVFLTFFYAIDAAYDLNLFQINTLHNYGRSINNFGTKTAGYYIRENTNSTARIFSEFGIPPARYFFYRDIVGDPDLFWSIYSSSSSDKLDFFKQYKSTIDYVVLTERTAKLFEQDLSQDFYKTVLIQSENKPIAFVYSKNKQKVKIMDIEDYDPLFDQKYGAWKSFYVDCYFCLNKPITRIKNN